MALKLDELLTKKKEPVQILDLSKSSANTKEEFKKLLEKVPEFKIKMEKVRAEDVKIRDKKYSFSTTKKELKPKLFPFANPIPSEMKCLRLDDLCSVGIQWRMLTSIRPKNKLDEEYYSKLIELGKLQTTSREKEKKTPLATFLRKTKTRSGVLESSFLSCRQCGEEFCFAETCGVFAYDCYERTTNASQEEELAAQDADNAEEKKRKRRKSTTKKTFLKPKKRKSTKPKTSSSQDTKVSNAISKAPAKTVVNKIRQLQKLSRAYTKNPTKSGVKPVNTRKSNVKRSIKSTKKEVKLAETAKITRK